MSKQNSVITAAKYATNPIKDMAAYTYTLERTRSYLRDSDTVLEIGCGTGSTALLLAESVGTYHGTDIFEAMIKIARGKVAETSLANLNFEAHPVLEGIYPHDGLDAVMAFNLLHLLRDIPATLDTARAALRPSGLFITKTPCLKDANWKIALVLKLIPLAQKLGKEPYVQSSGEPAGPLCGRPHDLTQRAFRQIQEGARVELVKPHEHDEDVAHRRFAIFVSAHGEDRTAEIEVGVIARIFAHQPCADWRVRNFQQDLIVIALLYAPRGHGV